MKLQKLVVGVAGFLLAFAAAVPVARASEANQKTILDFHEAVRIPGRVLPPGKYIFELMDGGNLSDMNLIAVYNAQRTRLIAIIQTDPAEHVESTNNTVLTFDFRNNGKPPLLLKWFYPGDLLGHEFIYRERVEDEIAHTDKVTFAVGSRGATAISSSRGNG